MVNNQSSHEIVSNVRFRAQVTLDPEAKSYDEDGCAPGLKKSKIPNLSDKRSGPLTVFVEVAGIEAIQSKTTPAQEDEEHLRDDGI